ncbi:MAG: polysaccharide ABC transporter ATP-binding protein [Saprospiraceae bacterium]|nr:polysaccharide ABC transporter ATP-binding protein [Saprospiraceae bacterium]
MKSEIPIIEVHNLSKKYTIGAAQPRYLSLRDSLSTTFKGVKNWGNTDKSDQLKPKDNTDFWALKDISFKVNAGESLGIIGRNGAGKSTLLKILSRITPPTSGRAVLRGRLASLLEVGTGFHPELTGRENVYFNGSILGLRKTEIDRQFDEIVDFSGVERFIDTPLKNYSSGMQLRLAFAVAAHLEPEILIIDEVLAVGDAEFQKKCLGKMDDVSKSGRTVVFVSHSMGLIQQLCSRSIWLEKGQIVEVGQTKNVIQHYLQSNTQSIAFTNEKEALKPIFLQKLQPVNAENVIVHTYLLDDAPIFEIILGINNFIENAVISLILLDKFKHRIFNIERPIHELRDKKSNKSHFLIKIPPRFLLPSDYSWHVAIHVPNDRMLDKAEDICSFSIADTGNEFTKYGQLNNGYIFAPVEITVL